MVENTTKDKILVIGLKGLILILVLAMVGWTISVVSGFDTIKEYSKNLNIPPINAEKDALPKLEYLHPYNQCLVLNAKEFDNYSAEQVDMFCAKLLIGNKKE